MVVIVAMAVIMAMGRVLIRMGMMLMVVIMVMILIKIMLVAVAVAVAVVVIMLVAMRVSMFLTRPVAMGMAMRVMVRMIMAMFMLMLMSMVLLLALDTRLALATTADSTHLFHLQLFDSKLFAVGDADTVAATFGTGVEPLAHRHRLVALQADTLPRNLDDLELGALRQAPPDHGVEAEAQGLGLDPRQGPDLQPDSLDPLEALASGLLFQNLEDPLAK
jgi:uncharacterized membrane protein YjgN (DUF898 family)